RASATVTRAIAISASSFRSASISTPSFASTMRHPPSATSSDARTRTRHRGHEAPYVNVQFLLSSASTHHRLRGEVFMASKKAKPSRAKSGSKMATKRANAAELKPREKHKGGPQKKGRRAKVPGEKKAQKGGVKSAKKPGKKT